MYLIQLWLVLFPELSLFRTGLVLKLLVELPLLNQVSIEGYGLDFLLKRRETLDFLDHLLLDIDLLIIVEGLVLFR